MPSLSAIRLPAVAAALFATVACGIDPEKIPSQQLYAKDATAVTDGDTVGFAIVGASRGPVPKVGLDDTNALVADLVDQAPVKALDFVVFTGDYVSRSSTAEWSAFSERWHDLLAGQATSEQKRRRKVVPVPGDQEYAGDKRLVGFGAAFEGVGAQIGFNRVGSWYHFDVQSNAKVWRFVVVDTHKAELGSRWQEQLFWLPKVVSDPSYDHLIVLMSDPWVTMAEGVSMDPGDGPSELLAIIDENAGLAKLVGVVTGGNHSNEVYLPSGNFGEGVIVAGNGAIEARDIARWGAADDAGLKDVKLEPLFDLALMAEFDRWNTARTYTEKTIDHAKARGAYETYTGVYEGGPFPVRGWWFGEIVGNKLSLGFRMRGHDGKFYDIYKLNWSKKNGWVPETTGKGSPKVVDEGSLD
jgi:hypothetical protein